MTVEEKEMFWTEEKMQEFFNIMRWMDKVNQEYMPNLWSCDPENIDNY